MTRARKRSSRKKKRRPAAAVAAILIIAAICIAGFYYTGTAVDGSDTAVHYVTVTAGSGSREIADQLKKQGLIRSRAGFLVRARLCGRAALQSGTYALRRSMSCSEIIDRIADGDVAAQSFTIAEGTPLYKIAEQLDEAGICSRKAFYREVEHGRFDYDFLDGATAGSARLEGFLYPDTYVVPMKASAHTVIDAMLRRFDEVIGSRRGIRRTVIKASIIQKEAGSGDGEMKKVSSVIDNRLAAGMPLQMDSIISYIHKEDKIRATWSDIRVKSNYNPYTNKGLPPGPICSPGKEAIYAALHPAATDYLYFVASAKMDGTNVYTKTYKEFLKNKKAFDKAYEAYVKEHPGEQ
ncbi:MAG: endolytic transglycosylase MltG [Anaerovoracaceae bacterium]|jgi:UPF0755 protein